MGRIGATSGRLSQKITYQKIQKMYDFLIKLRPIKKNMFSDALRYCSWFPTKKNMEMVKKQLKKREATFWCRFTFETGMSREMAVSLGDAEFAPKINFLGRFWAIGVKKHMLIKLLTGVIVDTFEPCVGRFKCSKQSPPEMLKEVSAELSVAKISKVPEKFVKTAFNRFLIPHNNKPGEHRIIYDARYFNAHCPNNYYRLPKLIEILNVIPKGSLFVIIDLKAAFHQINLVSSRVHIIS